MKGYYLILICFIIAACKPNAKENPKWTYLLNTDNLEQWDTYVGPHFGPGVSWDNIDKQLPAGLNNDSLNVFTVVELDNEKVLRISGQSWGGIFTKQEFSDYHLKLQFKWGEQKWYPREKENDKRDSGLLYHGIGTHGEDDLFWLKSQEFQIQEGDCGDFWGVAGTIVDVRARQAADSTYY